MVSTGTPLTGAPEHAAGRGLPPALCAGMAAQFAAGGAVVPFITLLLRDRGLSWSQITLIFTTASATMLVSPFFWGMLADRFVPLNRLFAVLNLFAGLALLFVAAEREFAPLLLACTAYFACFNPTLYLLNALSFRHLPNPREQFGHLRAWGSAGWILPFLPIALWLAMTRRPDLEFVLYIGIACCAVMTLISFWLPHTPPAATGHAGHGAVASKPNATRVYLRGVTKLMGDRNYLVVLLSMLLVAGSFSLLTYYSPGLLQEAGVPRPWIGPVQGIAVVFEIVLLQWQPALLRRWNYATIVIAGCAALALRHLIFATAANVWVLSASYLLAGCVIVFYHQGISLLVNSMAALEVRATAQTLLLLSGQGFGPLLANAVSTRLAAQTQALRPIFVLGAGLATVAAVLLATRGSRLNRAGKGLKD